MPNLNALIGTYTEPSLASQGIRVIQVSAEDGSLGDLGLAAITPNPTFLALHPNGRHLFAVNELEQHRTTVGGSVSSFELPAASMGWDEAAPLRKLNQQPTHGVAPCHLTVDSTGRWLLVANYGGGVTVLPILATGELGPASHFVEHQNARQNGGRQSGSHPHSVQQDPTTGHIYVPDLGIDQVKAYRLSAESGQLEPQPDHDVALTPGSGPRHMAFHPHGRFAFVANELNSTVSVLGRNVSSNAFVEVFSASAYDDTTQTTPAENYPAEIKVHPSGKYLYVSNRGHDSIGIFEINQDTGNLRPMGNEPTRGEWPRHFALNEVGDLLIVANQHTANVTSFHVKQDGTLAHTGHQATVPSPACVLPLTAPKHRPQP